MMVGGTSGGEVYVPAGNYEPGEEHHGGDHPQSIDPSDCADAPGPPTSLKTAMVAGTCWIVLLSFQRASIGDVSGYRDLLILSYYTWNVRTMNDAPGHRCYI